jgi:hypothetical protein
MSDEKRHQVFVSSTYQDLIEERQQVIQALLELDCFPCGMEYFPAANDEVWEAIKRLIGDCDYYLVIVAGCYGSVDPEEGISYTEKEYRYAVEKGIPVMAFLPADPGSIQLRRTEERPKYRKKLEEFKDFCKKRLCKHWSSAEDLRAKVTTSLVKLMKEHPTVGWVKGNLVSGESAKTILQLRNENDDLKAKLEKYQSEGPPGSEALAQGTDTIQITYFWTQTMGPAERQIVAMSWDQVFQSVGIILLSGALEPIMSQYLDAAIAREMHSGVTGTVKVEPSSFDKIKLQLRALDLIQCKERIWSLTERGERKLVKIAAISRGHHFG